MGPSVVPSTMPSSRRSGAWMQVELLNRKKWRTRVELANAMFEYLEIFDNRQRRHSALLKRRLEAATST